MTELSPAIPAATVVVIRDRPGQAPDLLVVERSAKMSFAAGAVVFPGGRIDEADRELGGDAAAKVTAIRETLEESAVAVGLGTVAAADGPALQAALIGGEPFAGLIDRLGLRLDPNALVPFARWRPAFAHARIFDTRFFLARAPAGDWNPIPQPGECAAAEWASAADLLARIAAGTATAIFPTKRNLERLATYADFDSAVADASRWPTDTITPWVETRDGVECLCIPEGSGYPVTSEPRATAFRA